MPNVTVRNIIVGPGNLFVADSTETNPDIDAGASASGTATYGDTLDTASGWDYLGATMEGVELTYEPDYGEIEVDQLKDAARLFNQGLTITVGTQLAETTLENLLVAWGLPDQNQYGNNTLTAGAANGGSARFIIGVPEEDPVERQLVLIGRAPLLSGDTNSPTDRGFRERIYHTTRVVSVEGSSFNNRRTEAVTFPVSFRVLPDDAATNGEEYGVVYDRYYNPA